MEIMLCLVMWLLLATWIMADNETEQGQELTACNARFGHGMDDNHRSGLAAKQFSAEMCEATGGKIRISVIANQALGPDPQMLGALQGGVQEFYTGSALAMLGQVKELGFKDDPFLLETEAEAHAVFDGPVDRKSVV